MKMKLGYVGLGKMGKNMVLRLSEQGIKIVAWNRSVEPREEVRKAGVEVADSLEELISKLKERPSSSLRASAKQSQSEITTSLKGHLDLLPSRNDGIIIWIMLTAGSATDEILNQLTPLLSKGDLVIDGGNSFYKDTLERAERLSKEGIHYMDIGTSGGPNGARTGACLMIGGSKEDFERIRPLVEAASAPQAYGHFGPVGSGHFAKMVHNGIEYGMMEAIGEGAAVLKSSGLKLDLAEVFRVYNNRSVIESRLVDWTQQALQEDSELSEISEVIGHSGEGEWTIKTAEELGVPVPVIKESFRVRVNSKEEPKGAKNPQAVIFRNRVVSAMRGKFGLHQVKRGSVG
ncbi:MAG: NADP-dependent phosphogluconate dehydrogenase [Candidatus Daviesbacteria bacterium]|nr:NADP-dependent phosphogluconate dehydrogenase [Candidatus Daviesbacteria bacterium]